MRARLLMLAAVSCQFILAQHLSAYGQGPPSYRLNANQQQVVQLTNLFPGSDCHPVRYTGKVVARQFDRNGTLLQSLTVESSNGERSFINVDPDPLRGLDRASLGWIAQGLQTLVRDGRELDLGTKLCGAAGRVEMLDAIYSSRAPQSAVAKSPAPTVSVPSVPAPTITPRPAPTTQSPKPRFSVYSLVVAGVIFFGASFLTRQIAMKTAREKILVGIAVAVGSSIILYFFGIKDELTLISISLFGGLLIVAVNTFF